ncbi:MAG: MazG nucleotide pyrophosphohydrolase domain-containing protein [Thermoleophilaceae bacterium]
MTEPAGALERLDEITRRLRRECPWDREQDERSIVPHTVEEAYELADAARSGDDAKLLDELGDVLFQVYFLSLLLEERGAGDLGQVADHCRRKLIRRHPHVFGEVQADDAAAVLDNWDAIKRETERGGEIFGELPETLPSTLYARKVLRRASGAGHDWPPGPPLAQLQEEAARLAAAGTRGERFDAAGSLLLAAVAAVGDAGADPELALRSAADRFRNDTEQEVRGTT